MTEPPNTNATSLTDPPRETSGARSANRFAFQKNWTLCRVLELHASGVPYVVVCEYHDDVAVLDQNPPAKVDFYQVKTSSTQWTLTRLLARAKGKKGTSGSILGKMYGHRKDHGSLVASTNFVSNARFNIELASKHRCPDLDRVGVHEFAEKRRTHAQTTVQTEHGLPSPADFGETTWFSVTELTPTAHETYARGALSKFLGEQHRDFNVSATYRVLFDEVEKKTDREGTFVTIADAIVAKGITRVQVETLLSESSRLPEVYRSVWSRAESRLTHEGVVFGALRQLHHSYTRYFAERMDESNDALQTVRNAVRARVSALVDSSPTLTSLLDTIASEFGSDMFPRTYVQAMAIMEMDDAPSTVQEAGSQPPESSS